MGTLIHNEIHEELHSREDYRNSTIDWKEYQKEYFKKVYFKDAMKYKAHKIRTRLNSMVKSYRLNRLSDRNLAWYGIAKFISDRRTKGLVIDHKISIPYFLEFDENLDPLIICNIINIQVITKGQNSSKRNKITNKEIAIARRLEKLYPAALTGFTEFLKEKMEESK